MAQHKEIFSYKGNISATQPTKDAWSYANKAVLQASVSHTMKSADEITPPKIGVVLARAVKKDFEDLGIFVESVTEVPKTDPNSVGMLYTMTATDTHGLSYVTNVCMDEDMYTAALDTSKLPMALHALRNTTARSHAFHNDVSAVVSLMGKAFGTNITDMGANHDIRDNTSYTTNTVGAESNVIRTFATDLESRNSNMFSTASVTTSMFNENHVPTHNIIVHTARVICTNPTEQSYIANQSVNIEEVGGIYSTSIVLTRVCAPDKLDETVYMAAPLIPFKRSDFHNPRESVVHIFTVGRHFAANVVHQYDTDAPRSVHLPVYAIMYALGQAHPTLNDDIKSCMCTGSMETLHTDVSTPTVIMRESVVPLVAIFAARLNIHSPETHGVDTDEEDSDKEWRTFQDLINSKDSDEEQDHHHQELPAVQNENVVYPENVRMAVLRHWSK